MHCLPQQPLSPSRLVLACRIGGLSAVLAIAACATSLVTLTGVARAPVSPDQVRVYTTAPASFEEVALLRASRKSVGAGGEAAIEKVIDEMKLQAAKLGANGLLLEDFSDAQSLTLGTGVGSDTFTHNGSISLGIGGAIGLIKKTGEGRAIFTAPVPP
jgi:hypothetical protein